MRVLLLVCALLWCRLPLLAEEIAMVTAPAGLTMRDGPSATSRAIKVLPKGTTVIINARTLLKERIEDRVGPWYRIELNVASDWGWVFGGFLDIGPAEVAKGRAAMEAWKKALTPEKLVALGEKKLALGQFPEARFVFEQAVARAPGRKKDLALRIAACEAALKEQEAKETPASSAVDDASEDRGSHPDRKISWKKRKGRFLGIEVGDYVHACFALAGGAKDSYYVGGWDLLGPYLTEFKTEPLTLHIKALESWIWEAGGYTPIERLEKLSGPVLDSTEFTLMLLENDSFATASERYEKEPGALGF